MLNLVVLLIQDAATNQAIPKTMSLSVISSISDVSPDEWDSCNLDSTGPEKYNPFLSHSFLSSLEESGSAVKVGSLLLKCNASPSFQVCFQESYVDY